MRKPVDLNKAEAGRELAEVNKEILAASSKLNKATSIPILLCLEDAVENCLLDFCKQDQVNGSFRNAEVSLLICLFIAEFQRQINDSIESIHDNGFLGSTEIASLPNLRFGIYVNQDIRDYMQELISLGKIDEEDAIFSSTEFSSSEGLLGGFIITLRKGSHKHQNPLRKTLRLRELFSRKSLLELMLRLPDGTKMEFDEKGMLRRILPQGMTPELLYDQIDSAYRFIQTNAFVPDWNSDFRDAWLATLKSPLFQGRENIARLKEEEGEFFKSYSAMKDYPKTFRELFGVNYADLSSIVSEMIHLCCSNPHTIGVLDRYQLVRKMKARTNARPKDIVRVMKLLSESQELKNKCCAVIILGNKILANFHRLNTARWVLSENCFEEAYNNDLKGKNFEKACRKLLTDKGLVTFPRRIDILEPMLPTRISYSLWGRQKKRSDIDVVSCSDNRMLVIECKELKSKKLEARQIKLLKKCTIEHVYKTKWIAENLGKFERYMGRNISNALAVNKKTTLYLFPLIVTNRPVSIREKEISPVTYLELSGIDFIRNLPTGTSKESSGFAEIQVLNGKISVPWFSVTSWQS